MTLIDELKDRRERQISARADILKLIEEQEDFVLGVERELDDLDLAIAALEPAPEEHLAPFADTNNHSFWEVRWDFSAGYYDCQRYAVEADALAEFDVLHTATLYKFDPDTDYVELARKSKHVVPAQAPAQPPSAELRSVTPATEEESGGQFEGEPSEFISDLTGDPAIEPESGLHGEPEPTELDAPVSIVDDPELLAAVSRAEATLAAAEPALPTMDDIIDPDFTGGMTSEQYLERLHSGKLDSPAYVGLQDPELDADWDAMKEREKADKPKLHFSIFGERGNRKLEEV